MKEEIIKRLEKLERKVIILQVWQDKIISELNSCSSGNHAYYSSFSLDAGEQLKREYPDLFPKEENEI